MLSWKKTIAIGVIVGAFIAMALSQFTHDSATEKMEHERKIVEITEFFAQQRLAIFKAGVVCGATATMEEASRMQRIGQDVNSIDKASTLRRALEIGKHDYTNLIPDFDIKPTN